MNKQRRCCIFSPPHDGLKAVVCWGRRKSPVSSHSPGPPELRCCLTVCTQPAPPDSIGANTVGALCLGGIWLLGSNSVPGEDDDNMLGGRGAWKKNDNASL